jgi:dihydroflavonol-4-reductase
MRIAVTGATGFLGRHLVPELGRRGHEVVPMSRHSARPGDILDRGYVASCLRDCQMVFHLAARVGSGFRPREYEVNLAGTRNLVEVSEELGVSRFVHISSLAVMGEDRRHVGTDETTPVPEDLPDRYSISKAAGERMVLDAHRGTPVVVIRPGWVWGPGDEGTRELFDMVRRGSFRFIGDGENLTYFVHVRNIVQLLASLVEIDPFPSGEVFNITDGDRRSMRDFVNDIAGGLGVERPVRTVPKSVAMAIATVYERLLRSRSLTRQNVNILSNDLYFPVDKARRVLGYSPSTDHVAQVAEMIEWLRGPEGGGPHQGT